MKNETEEGEHQKEGRRRRRREEEKEKKSYNNSLPTFYVEKPSDTKLLLCHSEGCLQVLFVAVLSSLPEVYQLGSAISSVVS